MTGWSVRWIPCRTDLLLTANCKTIEQLIFCSIPAICLFCWSAPSYMGIFLVQLFWVLCVYIPSPPPSLNNGMGCSWKTYLVKEMLVTMSCQMSSKDISIWFIWLWFMPQTNTLPQHPLSVGSHKMSHFLAEECDRLWLFRTQNFVNSLFFWSRKVEIDLIRPRRSCLTFCGKRFCGRFQTQKMCWMREGVEVVVGHSMGQFLFWQCVCLLYKGNIQI